MLELHERPTQATPQPASRRWRRAALLTGVIALIVIVSWLLLRDRPPLPPRDPAWLPEPRAHHTALALADGRVLVIGGSNVHKQTTRPLASAVMYDPATDHWVAAASPPATRDELWGRVLAASLGDGRVLVVLTGGPAENAAPPLVYTPATDRWEPTGPVDLPHAYHALALAGGGVLLIGGEEGGWLGGRLYDAANARWRETAPPQQRYDNSAAVALANGTALIVGQTYPEYRRSAERYDPATDSWVAVAPPPDWVPRDPQAVRLADGRVLFAGGYCCGPSTDRDPAAAALYDPVTDRWQEAGRMIAARWSDSLVLAALPDGRALVSGGRMIGRPTVGASSGAGSPEPIGTTAAAEIYDPATNGWAAATPLAQPRDGHTTTPLPDGRLLVVGGTGPLRECSIFEGCWPNGEFPTLAQVEWYRP